MTSTTESALGAKLELIVRGTPWLVHALEAIATVGLADWYLAAGAIRNTVWDSLHGRMSAQPLGDLDVIYFDEADAPQGGAAHALQAALPAYCWEVTNQATVHLWQSRATGRDVPPYSSTVEAMKSWPETATAVGVRLSRGGALEIAAPYGLSDLFAMTVRVSAHASDASAAARRVEQKGWHARWPQLTVDASLARASSPSLPHRE